MPRVKAHIAAIILGGLLGACGPRAVPVAAPTMSQASAPLAVAVAEFPVADGLQILGLTVAPDGVWFTYLALTADRSALRIGRISGTGAIETFAGANEHQSAYVAAAHDGTLWFTGGESNQVGHMTAAGVVRLRNPPSGRGLPQSTSYPTQIALGADGAMWFPEERANQISRIDSTGSITEFTLPTRDSRPYAIAAGNDGALWFTEPGHDRIGRITTAGLVIEREVPSANGFLGDIASGAGGSIWFTEPKSNKVGRFDPNGLTELDVPGGPLGIAMAGDGSIWVTETAAGKLARIAADGTITEFALPDAKGAPTHLAIAPDGALWFIEAALVRIAKVVPPQ